MTDLPDGPTDEVRTPELQDEVLPDLGGLGVIEAELDDVTRALERLDEGTYGTCEACGATLPDEVLVTAPASRRCVEHAA